MNALFGLLFGPNRIEYSVLPKILVHDAMQLLYMLFVSQTSNNISETVLDRDTDRKSYTLC